MKLYWASFPRFWLLLLVYFRSSFFDVVFYLLSEPLGVDFELPSKPSDSIVSSQADPPTLKNLEFPQGIFTFMKNNDLNPKMVLKAFGGVLGLLLGALGGLLAALWGLCIDHRGLPDSS